MMPLELYHRPPLPLAAERGPGLAGSGPQPADWPRLAGARGSLGILRWRVCPPTPPAGRRLTPLVPRKRYPCPRALPSPWMLHWPRMPRRRSREAERCAPGHKDGLGSPPSSRARGPIAQAHVPCAAGRSCSVRDISLVCARMKTAFCRLCLLAISVLPSACVCAC